MIHALIFALYAIGAGAAGLMLPRYVPFDLPPSIAIALVTFLGAALLHQTVTRYLQQRHLTRRQIVLKKAYEKVRDEADSLQKQVDRMLLAEDIGSSGAPSGRPQSDTKGDRSRNPDTREQTPRDALKRRRPGLPFRRAGPPADTGEAPDISETVDMQRQEVSPEVAMRQILVNAGSSAGSSAGELVAFDELGQNSPAVSNPGSQVANRPAPGIPREQTNPPFRRDRPIAAMEDDLDGDSPGQTRVRAGLSAADTDPKTAAELQVLQSLLERLSPNGEDGAHDEGAHDEGGEAAIDVAPVEEALATGTLGALGTLGAIAEDDDPADAPDPNAVLMGDTAGDDGEIVALVRDGLRENRVDLYTQPIVSLPQRKQRFQECYSRIRTPNGAAIAPEAYADEIDDPALHAAIDNILLFRCMQLIRKVRGADPTATFFCNISANTLSDTKFLHDFVAYMTTHAELAPNLVLEMSQDDMLTHDTTIAPCMTRLGEIGYRFSLDGVDRADLDGDMLESRHIHYLKIDAATILADPAPISGADVRLLKQQLDQKGIDLIVEGIESERMLVELLDFNIDYGQGYLFGEPRLNGDLPK